MMNKSDTHSTLFLKYIKGKDNWKAFKADGGDMGRAGKVIDTFVRKTDIFDDIDAGHKEHYIRTKYKLKKGAFDLKISQNKEYKA